MRSLISALLSSLIVAALMMGYCEHRVKVLEEKCKAHERLTKLLWETALRREYPE